MVAVVRRLAGIYAQILFSRSPAVGALLFLAILLAPRAAVFGLGGVLSSLAAAWLLGFEEEARREGVYSGSALLVGLGVGQSYAGLVPFLYLVLFAAPACALVTAALRAWFASVGLPTLSWPFQLVFGLTAALGATGAPMLPAALPVPDVLISLSHPVFAPLLLLCRGLAALFFLPHPLSGALVFGALLLHSRIAALLCASSFFLVNLIARHALGLSEEMMVHPLGYNVIFTALAIGSVYFVTTTSAIFLALGSAILCALITTSAVEPLLRMGVPLLVIPLNVTVPLVLFAMRQRGRDRHPKSVDFTSGTPEENLAHYRARVLRFGWLYPVSIRLPFRGTWLCTQSVDGEFTHQGKWRHAFDFEVRGADGKLFHEDGSKPEHYYCYRLPVLAAAAGTVVKVIDDVPDNPIGAMNLARNWGNLVIIQHGPHLFSLVAHLLPGSIKVRQGQPVRQGELLASCGNSGRSQQPHLHFQLQSSPEIGAPTIPCRFNDCVVVHEDGIGDLHNAYAPKKDELLRGLVPDETGGSYLCPRIGDTWELRGEAGPEKIRCEIDLLGQYCLRSQDSGRPNSALYFFPGEDLFTAYDVKGDSRSILHLLRAALPRAPFEASETLRWDDLLPARPYRGWLLRLLSDFAAPFLRNDAILVHYKMHREGPNLVVTGESARKDGKGAPVLTTRAEFLLRGGPVRINVVAHGRESRAESGQIPSKKEVEAKETP